MKITSLLHNLYGPGGVLLPSPKESSFQTIPLSYTSKAAPENTLVEEKRLCGDHPLVSTAPADFPSINLPNCCLIRVRGTFWRGGLTKMASCFLFCFTAQRQDSVPVVVGPRAMEAACALLIYDQSHKQQTGLRFEMRFLHLNLNCNWILFWIAEIRTGSEQQWQWFILPFHTHSNNQKIYGRMLQTVSDISVSSPHPSTSSDMHSSPSPFLLISTSFPISQPCREGAMEGAVERDKYGLACTSEGRKSISFD